MQIFFPTEEVDKCSKCNDELTPPVCGSDNHTYGDMCAFEVAACKNPEKKLKVAYEGKCSAKAKQPKKAKLKNVKDVKKDNRKIRR